MTGSKNVRFCSHCDLNVNNISALTRKQAMRLIRESKGEICVRYVKNPVDNTPLFADKLYQITRRATLAAGVLGASLAISTFAYAQGEPVLKLRETSEVSQKIEKDVPGTTSVSGYLTDQNGAVVPKASIILVNIKTSETRTANSDDAGFYEFQDVERGIYKLRFENSNGFGDKETIPFRIERGENLQRDLRLEPNISYEIMGGIGFVEFRTGLHLAVANDEVQEVRNLISRGGKVNEKDENYSNITPLFLAVENGNAEIAEILLNYGAKINARDDNRQTPLMRLDEDASEELVDLLIKHGARANLFDNAGNTALILAARAVKAEVLQRLIYHFSNINAQNSAGRTALMEAADADNLENVRTLLQAGALVNLKDKEGETAYDLTSDEEVEKLLVEYGANNSQNSN